MALSSIPVPRMRERSTFLDSSKVLGNHKDTVFLNNPGKVIFIIHGTKKSLEEHGDKVDGSTVEAIELAMKALEETLETEDADKITSGTQNLTDAAMKLGEAIYKSQQEAASAEGPSEDYSDEPQGVDQDIVDADFEDLDNDKH